MNPTDEQITSTVPRSKRGQTLVEFAMTLPILLMLMFGVIEFARIFQAWITLQNSARAAARYAVTGQWDPDVVAQFAGITNPGGLTGEEWKEYVLDTFVPCTTGPDEAFDWHWSRNCQPGDDEDQGLRQDMARLPSIVEKARIGAAGLSVKKGANIKGLHRPDGSIINTESVHENDAGWFHVWICSSRPAFTLEQADGTPLNRYTPSQDRNERHCEVMEGTAAGTDQYDAGGPGDAVEIIVFFNHPLITPLNLVDVDYIQLQARRVMINESFRSTRVVNLPPQLALPTLPPTDVPLPTNTLPPTMTPTVTLTPTDTPEPTQTNTPEPTGVPVCTNVTFSDARLVDNYLQVDISNTNSAPVFISGFDLYWRHDPSLYLGHGLYPDMYIDQARILGRSPFWASVHMGAISPVVRTSIIHAGATGWFTDASPYMARQVEGNQTRTVQIRFTNGPSDLNVFYEMGHFSGTIVYLSTSWGGLGWDGVNDCQVIIPGTPPTPDVTPPTDTPEPLCEDYDVDFAGFQDVGVVRYRIRNLGYAPAALTGFHIDWNSLNKPYNNPLRQISLDLVRVSGSSAFDSSGVKIWDSATNPTTRPVDARSNADNSSPPTDGWLATYTIDPGETVYVYLDFDGTSGYLSSGSVGYAEWDFNNTYFILNFACYNGQEQVPTPGPTNTPTHTNTPRPPTDTPTPGPPTNTYTPRPPTKTPTKTPNVTATFTRTPTATVTNTPIGDIGGE